MAIVKTIKTKRAVVSIDDSAFINKSESEIARAQETARRIAANILQAAMLRGEVEGVEISG
jgi:hypothetical protein